tara:strand:- start:39 stop:320 length:282 start_codon:yes stop_codon:yes gene_type:complete
MNFLKKLNNTHELLNKLDDVIIKNTGKDVLKNQLLNISEDLAKYKDLDENETKFESNDTKLKITDVLKRINEIEINVKNKLIITEKYNSYLNS